MNSSFSRILVLDDSKERIEQFSEHCPLNCEQHYTYNAQDCIQSLFNDPWDQVFLDHDLGEDQETGMEVCRWIVANMPTIHHIVLHTTNLPAASEMYHMLLASGYKVDVIPFPRLFDERGL